MRGMDMGLDWPDARTAAGPSPGSKQLGRVGESHHTPALRATLLPREPNPRPYCLRSPLERGARQGGVWRDSSLPCEADRHPLRIPARRVPQRKGQSLFVPDITGELDAGLRGAQAGGGQENPADRQE